MNGLPATQVNTQSQHGTLWPCLRICPNKISQPGLNVILAKSTAQTTKPACLLEEQFQAPGTAEQGTAYWRFSSFVCLSFT